MIKTAINSKDYIDIVKCDDHDIGKMIKMITVMITVMITMMITMITTITMIKVITMIVIMMMVTKNTMITMIRAIMVMIQVGGNMTAGEADALIRKVWYQDNSNCFTVSNTNAIFLLPYITYKQQKLSQYLFEQKSWLCLFRRTSIIVFNLFQLFFRRTNLSSFRIFPIYHGQKGTKRFFRRTRTETRRSTWASLGSSGRLLGAKDLVSEEVLVKKCLITFKDHLEKRKMRKSPLHQLIYKSLFSSGHKSCQMSFFNKIIHCISKIGRW